MLLMLPPMILAAALSSLQPTPLSVDCPSAASSHYTGRQPWLYINSGGTGVVYGSADNKVVLKVARQSSQSRVAHECEMINYVNSRIEHSGGKYKDVTFVKCLDQCAVDKSDRGILMSPLIPASFVSSFDTLSDDTISKTAVDNILRILDLLLSIGVAVSDLQLLISPETGEVYLIDLTESSLEDRSPSLPAVQMVLRHETRDLVFRRVDWPASRSNLVSEVVSAVPQRLHEYMFKQMRERFSDNEIIRNYVREVYD